MGSPADYDIWVDLNDLERNNVTRTLFEHCRPATDLSIGSRVIVGDDEGNRCQAEVVGYKRKSILLRVDLQTFVAAT